MNPLLQGPLRPAVWRVAWPAMAGQGLLFVANYADFMMLQHFVGDEAAAGQTIGWTMMWLVASLGDVFGIGITAVVARRVGEGRRDEARRAAFQGIAAALTASVIVGVVGWWLAPQLVDFYTGGGQAVGDGGKRAGAYTLDYLRVLFAGAPAYFLFYALQGTFKGNGDTMRPLRAQSWALVLNLILNPILIIVLELEVFGAALATVLSLALTTLLLARAGWALGLVAPVPRIQMRLVGRIIRIGFPLSAYGIVFSIVYQFIFRQLVIDGGDAAVTAIGHGLRLEGVVFMTSIGFSAAASASVGQNLGAGRPERAHRAAWLCVRLSVMVAGVWGLLLFVLPAGWVQWMVGAEHVATAQYAVLFLRIIAASLVFTAAEIALEGAFSGAGNALPPMLIGVPFTVLRIPLAAFLAGPVGWGVAGVYAAIAISSVIRGILIPIWFARGRWVKGKA